MLLRESIQWRGYDGSIYGVHSDNPLAFLAIKIENPSRSRSVTTLALVDTGHSHMEISSAIIDELTLEKTGDMPIHGNEHTRSMAVYSACVSLRSVPAVAVDMPALALQNPLGFKDAQAIIGMSFFRFGSLLVQGPEAESFFQFRQDRLQIHPTGGMGQ